MSDWSSFKTGSIFELFRTPDSGVTAIVGAGGKSSLLGSFARELREAGSSGLLSVTTKLKQSQQALGDTLIQHAADDSLPTLEEYRSRVPLLIRRPLPEREKLDGVSPGLICKIHAAYSALPILVEADGAAEGWLKVPGDREPQIPRCAGCVIALSAFPILGSPAHPGRVHRWKEFLEICLGAEGAPFSPEQAARLLSSPAGSFKDAPPKARRVWFINQADSHDERKQAVRFVEQLLDIAALSPGKGLCDRIIVGSLVSREFLFHDPPR